jgi:hypothetical protein
MNEYSDRQIIALMLYGICRSILFIGLTILFTILNVGGAIGIFNTHTNLVYMKTLYNAINFGALLFSCFKCFRNLKHAPRYP